VKQKQFLIFLLTLVFQTPIVLAEKMELEIIPLQNRMIEDVIHILRPLVTPGGTITGMNNQLIVKTTPDNLAEIKRVLESLDRPLRKLLITVTQDIGGQFQRREDALSVKYSTGDVSISSKDPNRSKEGLVIAAAEDKEDEEDEDDGNRIQYRNLSNQTTIDDRNAFRVQTLEGSPAFIQSGQSVPIRNQTAFVRPDGVVVNNTTEYYDATSGFYVLPRLNGDRVTLLVAPRLTSVQPGRTPTFDVQSVETTASGRLGEWIRIGGINQSFDDSSRQNFSSSSARGTETSSVLIKVDEIK